MSHYYQSLAEIEKVILAAHTSEEIGAIFRAIFGNGVNGFTEQSAFAIDALYAALERICENGGEPSAIELRDLRSTLWNALRDGPAIREEVISGNPAFKILIEAANDVEPEHIKSEAERQGKILIGNLDIEKDFGPRYAQYRQMLEELRNKEFTAARNEMARIVLDKMHCKPPLPSLNIIRRFNDMHYVSSADCPSKYWHTLKEYDEVRRECFSNAPDIWQAYREAQTRAEQYINSLLEEVQDIYGKVANTLLEQTAISEEEAMEWAASNVYMDSGVARKLKRINYPKEQLIKDVAEFYRYVGGKLAPIEFIGTRSDRAFAYSQKCQIAVSKYFDKRTLFHECGHVMEFLDTISLDCSTQFRNRRAQGNPESLADLTGNSDYKSYERAYPDSFISPYVGKIYTHAGSEVFSMAIEKMSSPEKLVELIKGDPEHFAMFLGVCAHTNPELTARLKRTSESLNIKKTIEANQDKNFQDWEKAIKKALPEFFMDVLLDQKGPGIDGFYITAKGDTPSSKGFLLRHDPDEFNRSWYISSGSTVATYVKAAYLVIMATRKLLNFEEIGEPHIDNLRKICDTYILNENVPSWFTKDMELPKLVLDPDSVAKARKKSPKIFLASIAAATPPDLFERMQKDEGVDGFMLPDWITPKTKDIPIVHKETDDRIYCTRKAVLPLAYLLIMNKRNLLPEHEKSVYMAGREFIYYASGKSVPAWFDPDIPLPELKYD